jgi:hypothetical protein
MLYIPAAKPETVKVAVPELRVAVPSVVEPFISNTVPVALLVTVAVKVIELPKEIGLAELVSVVVVATLTTWVTPLLVLVA